MADMHTELDRAMARQAPRDEWPTEAELLADEHPVAETTRLPSTGDFLTDLQEMAR